MSELSVNITPYSMMCQLVRTWNPENRTEWKRIIVCCKRKEQFSWFVNVSMFALHKPDKMNQH